jgi:hypothetical protein
MRTDGFMASHQRSAVCSMVLDNSGNLIGGVADMDLIQSIEPEEVSPLLITSRERKKAELMAKHRSSTISPSMIQLLSQWTPTFHPMYSGQ